MAYNEVVSPELHDAVRTLDEAFFASHEVFDHAKERFVKCPRQEEPMVDAAETEPAPAASRSPPFEQAFFLSDAASSSGDVAYTWQASWAWGLLSVGDC